MAIDSAPETRPDSGWKLSALDRISFLGICSVPHSRPDPPFRFALAATELIEGLALVGMYGTDICLGYETLFRSPGVGLGIYSSRVRVRAIIRSLRVLQVSGCPQTSHIYATDTYKLD